MDFVTQFNYIGIDSEVVDTESMFEYGTYRETKQTIEDFICSGKILSDARMNQFDDVSDDNFVDFDIPERDKNFDLADASQILVKGSLAAQALSVEASKSVAKQSEQNAENVKIVESKTVDSK